MQLTRTSDKLKRTIRFNAERSEVPFIAPMDSDYFSLILIKNGAGSVTVRTGTGEAATFSINTPMAICLRDQESLTFSMTDGDVYNLVFSPTFINVNMRPAVMEQDVYAILAETYHLFRLAPFMETHADLKRIEMSEEQMEVYFRICHAAVAVMEEEEPDNCWSCRIRANFMDILTGLETQYAHRIQALQDNSLTFMTYREIVIRIHNDLRHICRIGDVCRAFGVNKNKLQVIFRRYSGVSFYDFIKKARLERAQSYLAFTELSLSEIASRIGISTEQHFYRFYKRETGMAPAEFRKTIVAGRKDAFAKLAKLDSEDPGCYAANL